MGVMSAAIWQLAVNKLALDAMHRAINLCAEENAEDITVNVMTKGVVEGKSKKEHSYSPKRGLSLRYHGMKVTTEEMFTKPGLVVLDTDGLAQHYYKKLDGKSDTSKYGHRQPFNWEYDGSGNIDTVLCNSYQIDEKPLVEYKYTITPENIKIIITNLSKDMQIEEPLTEERINDIMGEFSEKMWDSWMRKKEENNRKKTLLDRIKFTESQAAGRVELFEFDLRRPVIGYAGGEEPLRRLHQLLGNQWDNEIVIICGEPGMGKSELARVYASRYRRHYRNIVWINADSFESMQSSFTRLSLCLGVNKEEQMLEGQAGRSINDVVDDVYHKILTETSLLIFDNAHQFTNDTNNDAGLDIFLPKENAERLHIIITSRHCDWDTLLPTINLEHYAEK